MVEAFVIPIDLFVGVILLVVVTFGFLVYTIQRQRRNIDDLCEALMALMASSAALASSSEDLFEARRRSPYCTCDVCQLLEVGADGTDDLG